MVVNDANVLFLYVELVIHMTASLMWNENSVSRRSCTVEPSAGHQGHYCTVAPSAGHLGRCCTLAPLAVTYIRQKNTVFGHQGCRCTSEPCVAHKG